MLFSSLPPKERFWANTAIVIIITVILVLAGIVWVLIQQKAQISGDGSTQQKKSAVVSSNVLNSLEPAAILEVGNDASTNMLVPLPAPVVSATNSN